MVVKVGLTADEYIALAQIAEAKGLTQSSYIRMLIKADISRESREVQNPAHFGPG